MLKNVIFDFGGVVYAYNTDDITRAFFPDEVDRALKISVGLNSKYN